MSGALALLPLPRLRDATGRSGARLLRVEIGVDEDEVVRWRLQTVRPRLVALFSRFT